MALLCIVQRQLGYLIKLETLGFPSLLHNRFGFSHELIGIILKYYYLNITHMIVLRLGKNTFYVKIVIYLEIIVRDTIFLNKCNPAIFFSKDLKLSVPASQQVWPNTFTAQTYD